MASTTTAMTHDELATDTYDDDGDGYSEADGDCDDTDPEGAPKASKCSTALMTDCDGLIDEGTDVYDDDGDGYAEVDGVR